MNSGMLSYRSSSISYLTGGHGQRCLFCFHGYGEQAISFEFLEAGLAADYRLFAINLPYHGETAWQEPELLRPDSLLEIMQQLATADGRAFENSSLLGFSLGARICFSVFGQAPQLFSKLVLLAPDGIRPNPWYHMATGSVIGRSLFRLTMHYPGLVFGLLSWGRRARMINLSEYRFLHTSLAEQKAREDLYNRWLSLRDFHPDIPDIKEKIRRYHPELYLLYGEYDRIIPFMSGQDFVKGIDEHCHRMIVACGHQVLRPSNAAAILSAFTTREGKNR